MEEYVEKVRLYFQTNPCRFGEMRNCLMCKKYRSYKLDTKILKNVLGKVELDIFK